MKRLVRIGLIGAGFIGRSHGLAVRAVNGVFPKCPIGAEPHILADDALGKTGPGPAEAARIGRLCEAILDSAASGQWVRRPEDAPSSHRTAA